MALSGHLRELRRRFLFAAAGVLVGTVAGWFVFDYLFELLREPIRASSGLANLNFRSLAGALDLKVRMSVVVGLVVSSPWWLWQTWRFLAPALKRTEKRYALAFVGVALPLFLGGITLAWLWLPRAVAVLLSFTPTDASNLIDGGDYFKFVIQFLLVFGFAFLFPLVMVTLSLFGVVSARTWLRGWRWAIIGITAFAAVATPTPDALSMILLAVPVIAMYFIAVGIAYLFERRRRKREARQEAADAQERAQRQRRPETGEQLAPSDLP